MPESANSLAKNKMTISQLQKKAKEEAPTYKSHVQLRRRTDVSEDKSLQESVAEPGKPLS